MIDDQTPDSPGWWLTRLSGMQAARDERLNKLDRYYRGEPDLPHVPSQTARGFRDMMRRSRTVWAELIVEAVRERMRPVGFRTGAEGDDNGDKEAWRIWQANALDADSVLVHRASLAMSDAYVIVGPVSAETGAAVITPEDPRQVITVEDPVQRRRTRVALKVFHDELLGVDRAFIYLPGEIWKAHRAPAPLGAAWTHAGWEWDPDPVEKLAHAVVPVVRFANRASILHAPMGEFEASIPDIDRINHMILQRMVIATMQAFRQRAISGVPTKDAAGKDVDYRDVFSADPGAMWHLPDGAKIWESQQADLGGILQAVRHDIQDLAASTRTPLFYLTPDAANGSAEGASLAREGLVFKTEDRIVQASESWEQVMSLAFLFAGDNERAARSDLECLWAPAERFTMAERYDAASKASGAGVPWRTVMREVLQFSPQEVERMEVEREADKQVASAVPPIKLYAPADPADPGAPVLVPTAPTHSMPMPPA